MSQISILEYLGMELEKQSEKEINREKLSNLIKDVVQEYKQLEFELGTINERYKKLIKHLGKDCIIDIINEDKQQQIEKMSGLWEDWIKEIEEL